MTSVLKRRGGTQRQTHTGRRLCNEVGRHRSDASISQGMPVLLLAIPKLREHETDSPLELSERI